MPFARTKEFTDVTIGFPREDHPRNIVFNLFNKAEELDDVRMRDFVQDAQLSAEGLGMTD